MSDFTFQVYTPEEDRFLYIWKDNIFFNEMRNGYIDFWKNVSTLFQWHSIVTEKQETCGWSWYRCIPEYGKDYLFFQKSIGKEKMDALTGFVERNDVTDSYQWHGW